MKQRAFQPDLFGDAAAAVPPSSSPVAVPRGPTPLTREQKAFNRLTGRVQRLRDDLQRWQDYLARYNQRISRELMPAATALRGAQGRLVLRLDALLRARERGERLSGARRSAVRAQLLLVAEEILEAGPDPEIEAVHDRYAETRHAEQAQAELEDLEAILGEVLGEEAIAGHEARDADELLRHVRERAAAHEEAQAQAQARRARGPTRGSARAEQAAARKAEVRSEALGTVRAIYRKLASALHPDREPDAELRARKTVLMQRANEAYERDDVLTLLSLQLDLAQIGPEDLSSAPPERLQQFSTILSEQADALRGELEDTIAYFRSMLGRPSGRLNPAMVDRALEEQLAGLNSVRRSIEADLGDLDDPVKRRQMIDALVAEARGPAFDPDDPVALLDAMLAAQASGGAPPARPGARKTKKKRRGRSKK